MCELSFYPSFVSRLHIYKLLRIFNHYKHRHCPFDRFVWFSYKFSKGIQMDISSCEILQTYTRHMINQSSTNGFLINIIGSTEY